MKNLIFITIAILGICLTDSIIAQTEGGLTNVYVTGPECCPDQGYMAGTRTDGGYTSYGYWGQTNGGGGPSYYNIPWTGGNFYVPCSSTLAVETNIGYADIHGNGVEVPIVCRGKQTKVIGYGVSLVFHIALNVLEVGEPGPPPPED